MVHIEDARKNNGLVHENKNVSESSVYSPYLGLGRERLSLSDNSSYLFQSDEVAEDVVKSEENIIFHDGRMMEDNSYGASSASSHAANLDQGAGLATYLSRPVQIVSFTWTEASTITSTVFQPWTLFFNNTYIKNKLSNYSRLRCKLHLKVILNASPFYYGLARMVYVPMCNGATNSRSYNLYQGTVTGQLIPCSQTPGLWLEPAAMSTSEMELPFLWHYDWLDTSQKDCFDSMGQLFFKEYSSLQSANGAVGQGITVRVFAWATDVELAGPSKALILQADEYEEKDGAISKPASALASVASKLTKIPVIGPYARVTEMGANVLSSVAKIFGYSNPPNVQDVIPMMPRPFHAFANVETCVPSDVLALDPKNEVSFDPQVAGASSEDELAISGLVSRYSYLYQTTWSNQAADTLLASHFVCPGLTYLQTATNWSIYWYTVLGYFNEMFQYWRGSIKYKIKVVCSKYHRGRLVIAWDPNKDISADSDVLTTNFIKILDIENETETEFVVPYKAMQSWLYRIRDTSNYGDSATPSYSTLDKNYYNGCLTVRVQNALTGPVASPSVQILISVAGGDDFEFAAPTDLPNAQTGNLLLQADEQIERVSKEPHINSYTVGETVASVRMLLHRMSFYGTQQAGDVRDSANSLYAAGAKTGTNLIPRVPDNYGFYLTGYGRESKGFSWCTAIDTTNQVFNFVKNHPICWVLDCFAGYRGSTRIAVNVTRSSNNPDVGALSASRYYSSIVLSDTRQARTRTTDTNNYTSDSSIARSSVVNTGGSNVPCQVSGNTGTSLTNTNTQGGLNITIPQYSNMRLITAYSWMRNYDFATQTFFNDNVVISSSFNNTATVSSTVGWPTLDIYYGAGVDFNPIFFICTAPILRFTSVPSAVNTAVP